MTSGNSEFRPAVGEAEDACPHCSPTHERPESRPWGVHVAPERDGDGQPTHLVVQPSNGAHVAQSDADWLWQLIRDYRPESARGDHAEAPVPAPQLPAGTTNGGGLVSPDDQAVSSRVCVKCGEPFEQASTGRPRKFCSQTCRQRWYEARKEAAIGPHPSREELGHRIREVWVRWASQQPDPKPSWLLPWEELDDGQREVDMRMGEALFALGMTWSPTPASLPGVETEWGHREPNGEYRAHRSEFVARLWRHPARREVGPWIEVPRG